MFKKYYLNFLYIGFFLILIPPIRLIWSFFTTHILAKSILTILFVLTLIYNYLESKKVVIENKKIVFLVLLFFISQSLSIIFATYPIIFLKRFQNTVFSFITFFLFIFYLKEYSYKKIVNILILSFIINSFFQLFIYFFPQQFIHFGYLFIHKGYMDLINYNIHRSRVYFESYNEVLIPIFFYLFIKNQKIRNKLIFFLFIYLQGFLSFIAGFRTNLLMFFFSFYFSFFLIGKKNWKYVFIFIIFIIFIIFSISFSNKLTSYFTNSIIIKRLLEEDLLEKNSTAITRVKQWKEAVKIGFSHPLFGVGLEHYSDYLEVKDKKNYSIDPLLKMGYELATQNPHNIFFATFAESGFFGLLTLIILLLYFLKKDLSFFIKKTDIQTKTFIFSFWVLFIYSFFNPVTTIKYHIFFYLFRIIIEYSNNTKRNYK